MSKVYVFQIEIKGSISSYMSELASQKVDGIVESIQLVQANEKFMILTVVTKI